jgi:hypothetical protein
VHLGSSLCADCISFNIKINCDDYIENDECSVAVASNVLDDYIENDECLSVAVASNVLDDYIENDECLSVAVASNVLVDDEETNKEKFSIVRQFAKIRNTCTPFGPRNLGTDGHGQDGINGELTPAACNSICKAMRLDMDDVIMDLGCSSGYALMVMSILSGNYSC